jgi:tetratricopeptide (TPR) repeat protein
MKHIIVLILLAILPLHEIRAQYNTNRLIISGQSALYYEDYVLSIQYFNQALAAKPYLYEPWYYRSVAKFNLDDFVGAEGDANEALKLNPYINDIYDLRAITRIRQGRYDEAISDYDAAIRLEPRNRNYRFNRAERGRRHTCRPPSCKGLG